MPLAQALFAIEKQPEKCRFQEERKQAFHGQGLPDYPAGEAREMRPVGAELKLHRNARHHADDEVNAEDLGPEAGRLVVAVVAGLQGDGFQDDDQRRQSHGQLREQVVIRHGEGEMQAMDQECAIHEWASGENLARKIAAERRHNGYGSHHPIIVGYSGCCGCDGDHIARELTFTRTDSHLPTSRIVNQASGVSGDFLQPAREVCLHAAASQCFTRLGPGWRNWQTQRT